MLFGEPAPNEQRRCVGFQAADNMKRLLPKGLQASGFSLIESKLQMPHIVRNVSREVGHLVS
jgi:hypothetical protein